MYGGIGHVFAPEEFPERGAGSPEGHLIVLNAVLGQHLQDFFLGALSADAFHRALVHVRADGFPVAVVNKLGQIDFTHLGWHHMAVLQVEVVVRPVQVGRHHSYIVGAILQVVALAHLQSRYLGNGIFLVGVLQLAREQAVLLHGLRCVLRVDASGAQEEQFLHPVSIGLADDGTLNLHVHHHEVRPVQAVGHDAAHKGSGQYYRIGLFFIEEPFYGHLVCQV